MQRDRVTRQTRAIKKLTTANQPRNRRQATRRKTSQPAKQTNQPTNKQTNQPTSTHTHKQIALLRTGPRSNKFACLSSTAAAKALQVNQCASSMLLAAATAKKLNSNRNGTNSSQTETDPRQGWPLNVPKITLPVWWIRGTQILRGTKASLARTHHLQPQDRLHGHSFSSCTLFPA